MPLDAFDKRLLFALDKNSRQSYSALAKQFKTSPQRIQYRVEQLVKDGVITSFMTSLSTKQLGYPLIVKLYIQFSGIDEQKEKDVYDFLHADGRVNWVSRVMGEFDLFTAVMVKDMESFMSFRKDFFSLFGKFINRYETSFIDKAYTFTRGYLVNKDPEQFKQAKIHDDAQIELSQTDMNLLRLLVDDSRASIVQLASKLKLDAKTVVRKIKLFEKQGVIQSYRINIDREKAGIKYYKVFIKLDLFDDASLRKLRSFLLAQKYIIHFIENVGYYEFELEIEIPTSLQLQQFTKNLRNTFPAIINSIVTTEIVEESKLTWLPKK